MDLPPTAIEEKLREVVSELPPNILRTDLHSINDLPDELLLEIAKHLEGDNPTLGNLNRTSRRFKAIGDELLYRTISLPRTRGDSVMYLVRTIVERPELRSKIRQLTLSTTSWRIDINGDTVVVGSIFTKTRPATSRDELGALLLQISQSLNSLSILGSGGPFQSMEEIDWRCTLLLGRLSSLAGLLLALCDNLDMLCIGMYHRDDLDIPALDVVHSLYGLHSNFMQQPPSRWSGFKQFHNVKRLRVSGLNMDMLRFPFMSLQVLEIDLSREYFSEDLPTPEHVFFGNKSTRCLSPRCANLDTLIIRSDWNELNDQAHLSHGYQLPILLQDFAGPTITRLEILFMRSPTVVQQWLGTFEHIARALGEDTDVSASLESMKIDYEESDHFDPRRCFGGCTNLHSFSSFRKLTKMEVLQGALVFEARNTFGELHYFSGVIPPPSLESLTVICPTKAILTWLNMIVERKTEVPALNNIVLLCRCGYGAGPKEFEDDVSTYVFAQLNDLGIDVRVVEETPGAFAALARKEGSVWEADWAEDGWVDGLFGQDQG
ncbi:uncharacterized protein J4E92_001691 [Alternaria infectoria]|uniref:uncharacterized protein n=1 Tax=Alternaria infectoria TaxID=45303 RepID=UPI002220A300|nr:uncharacterized protein J4E92_001691 [Alternaria infectoria]KAI4936966.1 hypothetical protein J4E92_001691 [Alternaria infectoria]